MTIKILEQLFINGTDLSYKNFMYNNECHIGGGGSQPSWRDVVISGIGSLTLVNAKADGLNYLKLYGGTEQRNLPSGYTQVAYLETDGNSYIDTGVLLNNTDPFDITFQSSKNSLTTPVMGAISGGASYSSTDNICVTYNITNGARSYSIYCDGAAGNANSCWNGGNYADTLKHTLKYTGLNTAPTIDGVAMTQLTPTTLTASNATKATWLFGRNNTGSGTKAQDGVRIFDTNFYTKGHFIPCRRYDGVLGVYNLVANTFLPNAGTGTFTAGADVTPSPDTPMDIVSNNGVITLSPNLIDESTLYIVSNTMWRYYSTPSQGGFDLKANTTYTLSTNNPDVYVYFYDYNTKTSLANGKNHKTYTPTADVKVYFTLYLSSGIPEDIHIQLEIGSTATTYRPYGSVWYDGTVETVEVTGKNVFDINNILLYGRAYTVEKSGNNIVATAASNTVAASRIDFFVPVSMFKENTTYYLSTKSDVTLTGNQCNIGKSTPQSSVGNAYYASIRTKENGGWSGAFTITDIAEGQEYVSFFYYLGAQDEGTVITISDIMISEGSTSTTYEPYFNGGTATAQPLLKVGDYKDTQEVLSGAVTRRIGIKVLDGTENWAASNTYQGSCWLNLPIHSQRYVCLCTHFDNVANISSYAQGKAYNEGYAINLWYSNNKTTAVAELKAFLAQQYANGTPVILLRALDTPTTESVTGQPLTIQAGTNVVEITQASIDNLELEVSYKAGVEVTVEEIEAVNNDESVEVTING